MFTENVVESMKFNKDPDKYLKDVLARLKREKLGFQDIEARESVLPYAPFICGSCGKLFIKDQAIMQQGMCDSCSGQIIANAVKEEFIDPKKGDIYECMKCGENAPLADIEENDNACLKCQSKHFVKTSLLERVMENTLDFNMAENNSLVDVWKETGGKVYAHYQYELENEDDEQNKMVNFVICASGQFTDRDLIYFDWNDGDPVARVYTMVKKKEDPLRKFDLNKRCVCAWAFDFGEENVPEFVDAKRNIIQKGQKVEYVLKEGPVKAVVEKLTPEGVEVSLIKHPDYGHNLESKNYKITLSQEDILTHSACCS